MKARAENKDKHEMKVTFSTERAPWWGKSEKQNQRMLFGTKH